MTSDAINQLFNLPKEPEILFEDYYCAVLVKPFGYTVEKHSHYPSIEAFFLSHLQANFPERKTHFIGIVHRLDVLTGGIVLVAKTAQALKFLNKQFEEKKAIKKYIALLEGKFALNDKLIKGFITEDKKNKKATFNTIEVPESKSCALEVEELSLSNENTLIHVNLLTGRFHQIRATFSFFGHPIVNDEKYGAKKITTDSKIFLIANSLEITHPKSNERIVFQIKKAL